MNEVISEKSEIPSSLPSFYLMITGLSLSTLGAAITGFSISLWILDHTESITLFTLVAAINTLPAVFLSPIAGTYVDRWNRRRVLIAAETGLGLSALCLAIIYWQGMLEIKYIMVFGAIGSFCQAFILPALSASTIMMVPAEQLTRANSVRVISMGLAQLTAPAFAGYLLVAIGLKGIFVLNLIGISMAIVSIFVISIPQPVKNKLENIENNIWSEINFAWQYLKQRNGLFLLLIFYAVVNFCIVSLNALFLPLVKSFASVQQLGLVLSLGGTGILLGGIGTMIFGNIRRKILASLAFSALISFAIIFSTMKPSLYIVGTGIFIIAALFPMIMSLSQTVWQQKLAPEVQGRIFGFRATLIGATMPLAYIISGILADKIFEPGMQPNGLLASFLGNIYGTGDGRGLAVMMGIYGLISLIAALLAFLHPRIRNLEKELPDCQVLVESEDQ